MTTSGLVRKVDHRRPGALEELTVVAVAEVQAEEIVGMRMNYMIEEIGADIMMRGEEFPIGIHVNDQ